MPPSDPQTQATTSTPPRPRRLDILRVGVARQLGRGELMLARTEDLVATEPLKADYEVSSKQH